MIGADERDEYISQITIGNRTFSLRDCGARELIAIGVSPEQLQSSIAKYHKEHPESDPTVGAIALADIAKIFE